MPPVSEKSIRRSSDCGKAKGVNVMSREGEEAWRPEISAKARRSFVWESRAENEPRGDSSASKGKFHMIWSPPPPRLLWLSVPGRAGKERRKKRKTKEGGEEEGGEEGRGEIGEIYSVRGISRGERTRERRIATKSQGAWALCQGAVPEKKKRVLGRERQGSLFSFCCSFRGLRRDNPQLVLAKSRVYGLIE